MFDKYFKYTLITLPVVLSLSFIGYLSPTVNTIFFFVIALITLFVSLRKLKYGLYILLAELFAGSFGYLFSLEYAGGKISIRMALFLVILAVFLTKFLMNPPVRYKIYSVFHLTSGRSKDNKDSPYLLERTVLVVFFILITWGVINGLARGNGFANVFFDANAYFYFALIFVFPAIMARGKNSSTCTENRQFHSLVYETKTTGDIIQVLLATAVILSIQTLFLFLVFSRELFTDSLPVIYKWIRDARLGEITPVKPAFYRIFIQSQIYVLISFLLLLPVLAAKIRGRANILKILGVLVLYASALIISFSRSYWIGGFIGFAVLFIYLLITKARWRKISLFLGKIIIVLSVSFLIVFLISTSFSPRLIKERSLITTEAAASTRLEELGPLWQAINKNLLLGSGFGKTITFKSLDPRITATHPDGLYTTYAFEWGYLDQMLKLGLLGMTVFLILIGGVFYQGLRLISSSSDRLLILGLLLGLLALSVTHIFSPYLNHPLGIGYLMLVMVIFHDSYQLLRIKIRPKGLA